MELENFVGQITDVLNTNGIQFSCKNIGHIRPINNDLSIIYFTKNLLIFFNDCKCIVDISFNYVNNVLYLKEMTIQVEGEKYGYKHCKAFETKPNKYHEIPLNTKLDENLLSYIKNYISVLIKFANDEKSLYNIWKKSLSRTSYKKKYPIFQADKMSYIDKNTYNLIEDKFGTIQILGEKIFLFDNEINLN